MIEERRRTALALVGEHLGKRHARTIVNGHKRRFVADAADMIAPIATCAPSADGDDCAGSNRARKSSMR